MIIIEGSCWFLKMVLILKQNGLYYDAETIVGIIDALDKSLKQEELDRIEQDEYLFGRLN